MMRHNDKGDIIVSDSSDRCFGVLEGIRENHQSRIYTETEYFDSKHAQNDSENNKICEQKNSEDAVTRSNSENDLSDVSELSEASEEQQPNSRQQLVLDGLKFILSHFKEPWFPRYISRAGTRKWCQEVHDVDTAMLHYGAALCENLRISAFGINQKNPDILFIDLDLVQFHGNLKRLNRALAETLAKIRYRLEGAVPTILWSGHGYHVILPIDCPVPLEESEKGLAALKPGREGGELSKAFMQFAERYLTSNKCDKSSHPSPNSCWLRIPGSINVKEGYEKAEVRIVKEWNGIRPSYKLLMGVFHAHLLSSASKRRTNDNNKVDNANINNEINCVYWIERLLQTPLADHRKYAIDLILTRYLILDKRLDEQAAYQIIMQWLEICNKVKRLDFIPHARTVEKIRQARRNQIKHVRLSTLKDRNPELWNNITSNGLVNMQNSKA
jgi:Primase X